MAPCLAIPLLLLALAVALASTSPVANRLAAHAIIGNCPKAAARSTFAYNYNPSWIDVKNGSGCLIIRVQNRSAAGDVLPSKMVKSCVVSNASADDTIVFTDITDEDVVFEPTAANELLGTEDPRIAETNGIYYLFYTAVSHAANGNWIARLSLATTTDPLNRTAWQRHGPLFPDVNGFQFTKSGALVVSSKPDVVPSYLIFGDCSLYQGLQVAVASKDLLRYEVLEDFLLIEKRPGMFDSGLVESGPPPLPLSDGNLLFIYNGAQPLQGVPNGLFYSPGWVILNGSNPLQVLQRASDPLAMPSYSFETMGLTPFVIFVEGLRRAPEKMQAGADRFVAYYGAADSCVGAMLVTVVAGGTRGATYTVSAA